MGRRADRNEVKKAKGNPGRRKIIDKAPKGAEPTPAAADGGLPEWVNTALAIKSARPRTAAQRAKFMTELTERVWNFVRPELVKMNLAKRIDEPALAIYCRAMAEFIAAIIELDRDGMTYKTESAHSGTLHRLHPATRIRKEALQTLKEYGDMLGITPLSRQRLFALMADEARGRLPLDANEMETEVKPASRDSAIGLLSRAASPTVN